MKIRSVNYENIISDFKSGLKTLELAEKYNQKLTNIQRIIRKYGDISKEFTEDYKNSIIKLYNSGISPKEISKILNLKVSRIYKYLKSISILKDKRSANKIHYCNSSYFKIIDSSDKAYFLGLLFADGCNTKIGLTISLAEKDKYILEKLRENLEFTGNLILRKARKINYSNQFCLQIFNKDLSNNLSDLGCIPRKSLILKFPIKEQVPEGLMSHFIRGYFDGDGCIFNPNGKSNSINFVGTKDFIISLKQHFINTLGVKDNKVFIGKNKITTTITWSSIRDTQLIKDYLYNNSNELYLKRKFKKFK